MNIRFIRKMAYHYLSHTTAQAADMSLQQLQQFIAGSFQPTEAQLAALARRMGIEEAAR